MTTGKEQFDVWWAEEGSAITPEFNHDHEEHAHRVSEIAWKNGVCCENGRWRNATFGVIASLNRFLSN